MQQVRKKSDHFVPTDRSATRLQVQLDPTLRGRHAQRANQVQPLIVCEAGVEGGRLPTWSPGPLQRRDERKARFIEKSEGGTQFTTVFLYAARHTASNEQWIFHLAPIRGVAASANSSRVVATRTKRRLTDSARGTSARSDERCDRGSSNLRHSPTHTHRVSKRPPTGGVVRPTNDWGVPARDHAACVWDAGIRDASGTRSEASRQPVLQSALDLVRVATRITHAYGGEPTVSMSRMVSCANYSTHLTNMNINY